ncbi:Retrovirus-related Pol polyprotein from transposon 17.6 [Merluccius polli]|uniref:ribonuclease H n=1 Tax=Merluccius polli TaxID=89951 RepID=A0AA47M657_MERPO|nr:Retrovirus-related Pol polyprotein from transposon 17.6 [Merluccius polli]
MTTLNLSQPAPFLQNAGEPAIPFKAWIRSFENYLLAMSEKDLLDARKRALLIHFHVSTGTHVSQGIELMLDTGSAVSILPREKYMQLFQDSSLTAPKLSLVSYGGNAIPVHGCLEARVAFGDRCTDAELYIVPNGSAVLGRDLFAALKMQILDGKVTSTPCSQTYSVTSNSAKLNTLGCAKAFTHLVKVRPEVKPVQQPLRRLPFSVREAVSQEIKRLVEQDIIEPVEASEWISPIVVIKKKDNGIRLCIDLREPNKAVVIDGHPLPHMEELFTELRGATMFSTLDLLSAYHQVTLHEDSRSLTTFITHDGLFRFKRVPYGLASAPSCFQRMMSMILKDQSGVQCYLDDIIVTGTTAEEHDRNLKAVLLRIDSAGLKLNYSKCHIRKTELTFLGHTVSAKGLQPDASHVDAVSQAPPPTDLLMLRSFLGLTGWYAKFIPDYAFVVEPLRALLRGSATFIWTPEAQQSFEAVKRLIVDSPALSLFDPELPTIVTTDASDYGLGAVLTQIHPDASERTVAFASRTLSPAERKYSTVEKEALGCVWATERWRTYLWGRHFTLRTDNSPLTTLLTSKGQGRAGMRVARWSARLLSFCYDIQYKPGRENVTADCLSRLPLPNS